MIKKHKNNDELMLTWLNELRLANCSLHTLAAYQRDLTNLLQFLQPQGLDFFEFSSALVQSYVTQRLEVDAVSANSVQRELSAMRQFYSWLLKHRYIKKNPLIGFKIKRQPRKLPEIIDIDTISQLLDQPAPEKPTQIPLWVRDKAILELIYSAGLRVAEVTQMNITDIDIAQKQVRVTGKGNKTRILPIGRKAILALQQWLQQRQLWLQGADADEKAVFLNKATKSRAASRLSTRSVERRIQFHAQRCGIDKRLYPHLLRHCFASHMLSGSGDLRAVQELLGHANISTTQIYTHLDFEKLAHVYDNSHPRANIDGG